MTFCHVNRELLLLDFLHVSTCSYVCHAFLSKKKIETVIGNFAAASSKQEKPVCPMKDQALKCYFFRY